MRALALFAVPFLLFGGVSGLVLEPAGEASGPVTAELAFAQAYVDGALTMTSPSGSLIAEGPRPWRLEAASLELRVVRQTEEGVERPFGGDLVGIITAKGTETTHFEGAVVSPQRAGPDALLYTFRDAGASAGGFVFGFGHVAGNPFRPSVRDVGVALGDKGQANDFHHSVPAPAFGFDRSGKSALPLLAPEAAGAEGTLTLVVDNVVITATDRSGTQTVETGQRRTKASVGPLDTPHYRLERTYAVLEAHGARLFVEPGDHLAFASPTPIYHLDGLIRIPVATGSLELGSQARGVERKQVEMQGSFDVAPRAERTSGPVALLGSSTQVHGRVNGDASEVRVGGLLQVQPSTTPDSVRAASLAAVVLGLLATAWMALQKTLVPGLLPLYARLAGQEALSNRARLAIYREVEGRPFVHLREVQRSTGFGFGAVAYHLMVLKRERLIASVRQPGRELFYIPRTNVQGATARALALLAHPTRRRIAEHVLAEGASSQRDLVQRLQVHQGAISRQLARMEQGGLLRSEGARNKRYMATPLLAAWSPRETAVPPAPSPIAAAS